MSRFKERPCPLCRVPIRLPENQLCRDCIREIENLRRLRPLAEKLEAEERSPRYMGERAYVPSHARYISTPHDREEDSGGPGAQRFAIAMREFLFACVPNYEVQTKLPQWPNYLFADHERAMRALSHRRDSHAAKRQHVVEITEKQTETLYELYHAINDMLLDAHLEGKSLGRQLLTQLASGELTHGQFEDAIERDTQRVRQQIEYQRQRDTNTEERPRRMTRKR